MTGSDLRYIKAHALARIVYLDRLRKVINAHFAPSPNPKDRVRLSEVAAWVAVKVEKEDSPTFRRSVRQAARLAGFRRVVTKGRIKRYVGMVAR